MSLAEDLEELRQAALELLIDECVVYRPALMADGAGGHTESLTQVYSGACSLTRPRRDMARVEGVMLERIETAVLLPDGTDVQAGDLIDCRSRRFRVAAAWRATSGAFLWAACEHVSD